ncbi:hypothetical protein V1511DRAFT_505613 [Dipodascopsis uninucleata]
MKIFNIFFFVAFATIGFLGRVYSDPLVELTAFAPGAQIDNYKLSSIHEGAGINYFFLYNSSNGQVLNYNETGQQLWANLSSYIYTVGVIYNVLYLSVVSTADKITFASNGTLLLNGTSDGFYGCKNVNDPYNYSSQSYEVTHISQDEKPLSTDCIPFTIVGNLTTSNVTSSHGSGW